MSEISRVAEILLEKTTDGKIDWEAISEDEFFTEITGKVITVRRSKTRTNSVVYSVDVSDDNGNVIERSVQAAGTGGLSQKIYGAARRNALKIDETLSEIEAALKLL